MTVETHRLPVSSQGHTHVLDLSAQVDAAIASGSVRDGIVTVSVVGSTASISTTEFEPGLVGTDLRAGYEKFSPEDGYYEHENTWHDDNGHAHVRATFTGPSITLPLIDGKLALGTWQQIVLLDFDTRPRERDIIVQVLGE